MPFFINAFFELATERGMGGAIPRTAILAYGQEHGFDGEWLAEFRRIVRTLENHFTMVQERRGKGGHPPAIREKDPSTGKTR